MVRSCRPRRRYQFFLCVTYVAMCFFLLPSLRANADGGADPTFSPVRLQEAVRWVESYDRFQSYAQGTALRDFIEIVYDKLTDRPWGQQELQRQIERRWARMREVSCPQLQNLCALPASTQDLDRLTRGLYSDPVYTELQTQFASTSSPYFLDAVSYPNVNESVDPDGFDFHMSALQDVRTYSSLQLWDMSMENAVLKEKAHTVIFDRTSRFNGFFQKEFAGYTAIGKNGEAILDLDAIKRQAERFGLAWKWSAERTADINSGLFDDPYFFHEFAKDNEARFQPLYDSLLLKLSEYPESVANAHKERFREERAKGHWPVEVYQYLGFELLMPLARAEAQYLQLARAFRPHLNWKRLVWEMFLSLQIRSDARLASFLLLYEPVSGPGVILHQFYNPGDIARIQYEQLKAIIGIEEYADELVFQRFKYALMDERLFSKDYLQRENPSLLEKLRARDGTVRAVSQLSEEEQRSVFWSYLRHPEGVSVSGLHRLSRVLAAKIRAEDAAALAEFIHRKHAVEFARGGSVIRL
ncbi:MAG: hypothetical protein AB7G93_10885 [Bdellovibrionales bacterium]